MEEIVLDHGFVKLEDVFGDESTIVNCARISTGDKVKTIETMDEQDFKLLRFLIENDHGTPLEHCVFRFRIKAPIFVMRQWMRHRIGTFNEFSMRYRVPTNEFYTPTNIPYKTKYKKLMMKLFKFYNKGYQNKQINHDVTGVSNERYRELFRCALPVATYTTVIWTVNLRSLMNFLKLRQASNAQYEIFLYAQAINSMIKKRFPHIINE